MDLPLYQSVSQSTEKMYAPDMRLKHAAIGLQTEIGEFATQVKRIAIYEKKPTDMKEGKTLIDHMAEELGDAMWYAVIPFNVDSIELAAIINNEHSWAQGLAAQMGFSPELETLDAAQSNAVLLGVTLQMGVDLGRFIQNLAGSKRHAQANVASIASLIKDACRLLGLDFGDVLQQNVDKLQGADGRYGSAGYSNAAAEARADKGGADARSS
jgi:NTP pyrophosphatase (non-canonical NTP hydrolase)